jgi:hypothetical protein
MTSDSFFAQMQRSWAVLTMAGVIVGALGFKLITPASQQSAIAVEIAKQQAANAAEVAKNATQIEYNTKRIDRLETAMTILALKACSDKTLARYEAIQLQCAQLAQLGTPR